MGLNVVLSHPVPCHDPCDLKIYTVIEYMDSNMRRLFTLFTFYYLR